MCWGVGEVREEAWEVSGKVRKYVGGGEEVWGNVWERVYGVSVEDVGKCVGVWGR